MNKTNEKEPIIIDGQSEIVITHSKRRKINDILLFVIWTLIGSAFIVIGILLTNQSIFLRILSIISGSILIISFFESFLSKLTNKIILNPIELKMRLFFKWDVLPWDKITSIELDKKTSISRKNEIQKRITIIKINSVDNDFILYPLYKFSAPEAESVIDLIKGYFNIIRNVDLTEIIVGEEKDTAVVTESPEELEERLNLQIPDRVEDFEVENESKKETE